MEKNKAALQLDLCYHCGEKCEENSIHYDAREFCCTGCKNVYALLKENNMCDFYTLNDRAGLSRKNIDASAYLFLDEPDIENKLIQYKDDRITKVELFIPQIHCSSCIWLLENLQSIFPQIQYSTVNFSNKTVNIQFDHTQLSLRQLAEKLDSIGYAAVFNFDSLHKKKKKADRSHWYRIGVAGFSFGNIMLLSLPEYFDTEMAHTPGFQLFFRLANIAFALPVLFYSSTIYLKSAWSAVKSKTMNIDIPIAVGLLVLFGRSIVEIALNIGPGYLDSFCALIFFMSIGRAFQQITYEGISFDKDFGSFFPISIQKEIEGKWKYVPANTIHAGDKIKVKNKEIIPADCILLSSHATIDAAFVTGESREIRLKKGDKVYAGCKVNGMSAELEVEKEMAEGHLTKLWNHKAFQKEGAKIQNITDRLSYYFTPIIGLISLIALLSHGFIWGEWSRGLNALTAVLIIACPCALGLAAPFGFGTFIRLIAKRGLFIKNAEAVEQMAHIQHVVFDKTGTLTIPETGEIQWHGKTLAEEDLMALKTLAEHSTHPLSVSIFNHLSCPTFPEIFDFEELEGKGLNARINQKFYMLGSAEYTGAEKHAQQRESITYFRINDEVYGYFSFANTYREGLEELIQDWKKEMSFSILSGDNDSERQRLEKYFGKETEIVFECSPEEKLNYIENKSAQGKKVAMLGDGLNDAGALKVAHLGIGIADNNSQFSPASDAILSAKSLSKLPQIFRMSKKTIFIIKLGFGLSLLYNIIGISVAVVGNLSPVFAAILMPISSISVVSLVSGLVAWNLNKNLPHRLEEKA